MITIFWGPGEVGKREELSVWRSKFDHTIVVDLKDKSVGELIMELRSLSLFDPGSKLVVAENTPETLDLQGLSDLGHRYALLLLAANPKSDSRLMVSAKKVGAKTVEFKTEKELNAFPFVDALLEGRTVALVELRKLLEGYGGMYVLGMIYYALRRNILPQSSSFMRDKVRRQRCGRGDLDWQELYRHTLETEYQIKSGVISEELGLTRLVHLFWCKH